MATPAETEAFARQLQDAFDVPVNGGLWNAMKKLTTTEQRVLGAYIGEVAAHFRDDVLKETTL